MLFTTKEGFSALFFARIDVSHNALNDGSAMDKTEWSRTISHHTELAKPPVHASCPPQTDLPSLTPLPSQLHWIPAWTHHIFLLAQRYVIQRCRLDLEIDISHWSIREWFARTSIIATKFVELALQRGNTIYEWAHKIPRAAHFTACSTSASSNTMWGLFPPNSSVTTFRLDLAEASWIWKKWIRPSSDHSYDCSVPYDQW